MNIEGLRNKLIVYTYYYYYYYFELFRYNLVFFFTVLQHQLSC